MGDGLVKVRFPDVTIDANSLSTDYPVGRLGSFSTHSHTSHQGYDITVRSQDDMRRFMVIPSRCVCSLQYWFVSHHDCHLGLQRTTLPLLVCYTQRLSIDSLHLHCPSPLSLSLLCLVVDLACFKASRAGMCSGLVLRYVGLRTFNVLESSSWDFTRVRSNLLRFTNSANSEGQNYALQREASPARVNVLLLEATGYSEKEIVHNVIYRITMHAMIAAFFLLFSFFIFFIHFSFFLLLFSLLTV